MQREEMSDTCIYCQQYKREKWQLIVWYCLGDLCLTQRTKDLFIVFIFVSTMFSLFFFTAMGGFTTSFYHTISWPTLTTNVTCQLVYDAQHLSPVYDYSGHKVLMINHHVQWSYYVEEKQEMYNGSMNVSQLCASHFDIDCNCYDTQGLSKNITEYIWIDARNGELFDNNVYGVRFLGIVALLCIFFWLHVWTTLWAQTMYIQKYNTFCNRHNSYHIRSTQFLTFLQGTSKPQKGSAMHKFVSHSFYDHYTIMPHIHSFLCHPSSKYHHHITILQRKVNRVNNIDNTNNIHTVQSYGTFDA